MIFEYKQEIGLLHSSLLSAEKLNLKKLFDCDDVETAVKIVTKSIKNIILYKSHSIKGEKENVEMVLHVNENLHTPIFFTLLRSYGIESKDANTFYATVAYPAWPSLNLNFYVELSFKCDWSEYFIKSAAQLPVDVLCKILKLLLDISSSSHLECYIWHLILQTIIFKLIEVSDEDDKKCYPFNFYSTSETFTSIRDEADNETSEESQENGDDTDINSKLVMAPLKELFSDICSRISVKMNKSKELDILKIILHAAKSVLKSLITEKEEKTSQFPDLLNIIFPLYKDCVLLEDYGIVLKAALHQGSCLVVKHAYATCSWNISLEYLLFLLCYYHSELRQGSSSELQLPEKVKLVYPEVVGYGTELQCTYFDASSPGYDKFVKKLCKIIQLGFEGQSYAAELLLLDPNSVESSDVAFVLEENSQNINIERLYAIIVDNVMKSKSQESKFKLIKLLYKILREHPIEMYNTVLNYILFTHGATDDFKLPDFEQRLSEFTRKTPTLKEIENVLPELFIQNPVNVLNYLIAQALVQGSEGQPFIQFLKHFPNACLYCKDDDLPVLHSILNDYFEKNELEACVSKNITTVYKYLIEVHLEKPILLPTSFFSNCIIPKMRPNSDKIDLILECSLVLIPAILSTNFETEVIISLIVSLGELVDHSIKIGNGKQKSLITSLLKMIETYQIKNECIKEEEKFKCWSFIAPLKFSEMTYVYLKEFLPKNIELFSSKEYIWTYCCKNEDSSLFQDNFLNEKFTYSELIDTLVEVLPHLTKEEWLHSYNFVKQCCTDSTLRDDIMCSFDKLFKFSEGESIMYAMISCFTTSLKFILNNNISDPLFVISCFSSGLMDLMNKRENVCRMLLIVIFLDLCHLVECISSDFIQAFTAVLLELKKLIMDTCCIETDEKDCRKLISDAVLCLPDTSEKMILYQKL